VVIWALTLSTASLTAPGHLGRTAPGNRAKSCDTVHAPGFLACARSGVQPDEEAAGLCLVSEFCGQIGRVARTNEHHADGTESADRIGQQDRLVALAAQAQAAAVAEVPGVRGHHGDEVCPASPAGSARR
jgi:hypothetical protein